MHRHARLHSAAHNLAQSLAGGLSFIVPHHVLHVHPFSEAGANGGADAADILQGAPTARFGAGSWTTPSAFCTSRSPPSATGTVWMRMNTPPASFVSRRATMATASP